MLAGIRVAAGGNVGVIVGCDASVEVEIGVALGPQAEMTIISNRKIPPRTIFFMVFLHASFLL